MPTTVEPATKKEDLQLLIFFLADEEFALGLTDVREIVRTPEITPVPNMSRSVKGVANLRGKVVTIIDLEEVFHLKHAAKSAHPKAAQVVEDIAEESAKKAARLDANGQAAEDASSSDKASDIVDNQHVIIAERGDEFFGLLVDSATEVLRTASENLKSTPELLKSRVHADDVRGVIVLNEKAGKQKGTVEKARMILMLDLPRILSDFSSIQD